jgi:hypothetical protein
MRRAGFRIQIFGQATVFPLNGSVRYELLLLVDFFKGGFYLA